MHQVAENHQLKPNSIVYKMFNNLYSPVASQTYTNKLMSTTSSSYDCRMSFMNIVLGIFLCNLNDTRNISLIEKW